MAGCVFVPLSPEFPKQQLDTIVSEISPQWFIVNSKTIHTLSDLNDMHTLQSKVICMDKSKVSEQDKYNFNLIDYEEHPGLKKVMVRLEMDDLCYIYFTSGSTGKPKGIAGRLKSIAHFISWEIQTFNVRELMRFSQLTTPIFDAFMRDVFVPLCSGGVICIPEDTDIILDSRKLLDWIDHQQINLIHCVPSLFRSILSGDLTAAKLLDLNYVLLAGEPLLPVDLVRWMDIYGERIQLVNLYGPSETTMTKLFYFIQPSDQERRSIPIGKPMQGATAVIVDEKQEICPPGMVGEIYIRTPYRTLGYYNQPALTNKVFIQNPFSDAPNDIVYKTGDLGRVLEDGNFECLGRLDQQVKIRGVRIELGEIENQLRLHPWVQDGVVVDWDDLEGNKYLCAYVVVTQSLESSALREFLSQSLAVSMLPSVFVVLDVLPRTLSGKVDRRSLPTPEQARQQLNRPFVAPRTPVEKQLTSIWSQVLNLERISVHDNFFELGGHSLLATQLVSRTSKAFQMELPLRVLLESPTLAGMAQSLETIQWAAQAVSVPPPHSDEVWEEGEL